MVLWPTIVFIGPLNWVLGSMVTSPRGKYPLYTTGASVGTTETTTCNVAVQPKCQYDDRDHIKKRDSIFLKTCDEVQCIIFLVPFC